jgi:hypothetical protein
MLLKTDPTRAQELLQQGANKFTGDKYAKALQAGRNEVQRIMQDRELTADEKRSAIDLTYLYMIEIAKQGVEAFNSTGGSRAANPRRPAA